MKQYKISFFENKKNAEPSVHYREFETVGEVREWAYDYLSQCSQYCRFEYEIVTVEEFLAHTP